VGGRIAEAQARPPQPTRLAAAAQAAAAPADAAMVDAVAAGLAEMVARAAAPGAAEARRALSDPRYDARNCASN
jgi:hypothetical protein